MEMGGRDAGRGEDEFVFWKSYCLDIFAPEGCFGRHFDET